MPKRPIGSVWKFTGGDNSVWRVEWHNGEKRYANIAECVSDGDFHKIGKWGTVELSNGLWTNIRVNQSVFTDSEYEELLV